MAFRKNVFTEFGLFRTDLGRKKDVLLSGEDTDLFRRLIRARAGVVYTPHSIVCHPVEKSPMQKEYFRRWYFTYGKSRIRLEGVAREATFYFGVPRYLWRELLTTAAKWLVTFDPAERFNRRMQLCVAAGAISESRRCREVAAPGDGRSSARYWPV